MALSELRRCVAWDGTMCNPRALHPALYDLVFMEVSILGANVMAQCISVYECKDEYKKTTSYVYYASKLRS